MSAAREACAQARPSLGPKHSTPGARGNVHLRLEEMIGTSPFWAVLECGSLWVMLEGGPI